MQDGWAGGLVRRVAVVGAVIVCLYSGEVLAQGATGGSIGKQDKSVGGGEDSGGGSRSTSREHERPSKSERSSKRERGGGGGGGGGNVDGTWASASQGRTTCSDRTSAVVAISGGNMVSDGFTGRVTSGGSVSGVWAGSGLTATVRGHMSGRSGSGTFRRSDGCEGTWTLSKQ